MEFLKQREKDKGTIASKELAQWKLDDEQSALIDLWKKYIKKHKKLKITKININMEYIKSLKN